MAFKRECNKLSIFQDLPWQSQLKFITGTANRLNPFVNMGREKQGFITTDDWGSYAREVPSEIHLVGKIFTQRIEIYAYPLSAWHVA